MSTIMVIRSIKVIMTNFNISLDNLKFIFYKKGAKKSWRRGPGPGMGIISLTRGFETLMT